MALVVEDGTGLASAESYASLAAATEYTGRFGLAWAGDNAEKEVALRSATRWIDAKYGGRFVGVRRYGWAQALEWPRAGALVPGGAYGAMITLSDAVVPAELVGATVEAAVREARNPGVLFPDLDRGGGLKRHRAGDTEREWFPGADAGTVITVVQSIISGLVRPESLTGRASRG